MLAALKSLFELPQADTDADRQHRVDIAAAAILIETARSDFTQSAEEEAALQKLLSESLNLSQQEVLELFVAAQERVDDATSLYEFTRVINDNYSAQQKVQLVSAMWAVAYADGKLDKYEEHLIRQVAELTYVPHQDYIRSKQAMREGITPAPAQQSGP